MTTPSPRPVGITLHRASHLLEVEFDSDVNIAEVAPVGQYGVLLRFDDGHDTGIFSWSVLYDLGSHQAEYWQRYLEQLAAANLSR